MIKLIIDSILYLYLYNYKYIILKYNVYRDKRFQTR
jgi:hypothetical protein